MLKHAEVMLHNYKLIKVAQGAAGMGAGPGAAGMGGGAGGGVPATPDAPWYSPESLQGLGQDMYGQAEQFAGQVPGHLENALAQAQQYASQAGGHGQDLYNQASQFAGQIPGHLQQGMSQAQEAISPFSQKAMELLRSLPQMGGEAAQSAAGAVPPVG